MPKGILFLAPGFEEIEAVTAIDLLRRASIEVTTASVGSKDVTGSHDITVAADIVAEDAPAPESFDFVVLPGGMPGAKNLYENDSVKKYISRINEKGGLVCAICAAPAVVLHPMGLLKNKKATCFPKFADRLTDAHFSEDRVVRDGNIITSRGAGTAAEFACAVIETLTDADTAKKIHDSTLQK